MTGFFKMRFCLARAVLVGFTICGLVPWAAAADPMPLIAPPTKGECETLLASVKAIFKDEFAGKTPQSRTKLCRKLIDESRKLGNDHAAQFVMLKEAHDQALILGDAELTFETISDMGKVFSIDATLYEADAVLALSKNVRTPQASAGLATRAQDVAERLADREDYDAAGKLLTVATALASKSLDKGLQKSVGDRLKAVQLAKDEFARFNAARDKLAADPRDRDANLTVARYLCLNKEDWGNGLVYLSRTGDSGWKETAEWDLATAQGNANAADLGNRWYALVEKASPALKPVAQHRARFWYAKAAGQATGLEKALIEKRMAELAPLNAPLLKPIELPLADNVKITFRYIPAGRFSMGSPPDEMYRKDNETQHPVTITRPFYLGQTEVTQAQWQAVTNGNPATHKGDPNLPVETIDWETANAYCQALTKAFAARQLKFRLPTEAEWEYACRAGSTTMFHFGGDPGKLGEYAWFADNSKKATHPVGQLKANAWGLYDMYGNVGEWCLDSFGPYESKAAIDPNQQTSSDRRMLRGGNYWSGMESISFFRSAGRGANSPNENKPYAGLRVLLEVPQ